MATLPSLNRFRCVLASAGDEGYMDFLQPNGVLIPIELILVHLNLGTMNPLGHDEGAVEQQILRVRSVASVTAVVEVFTNWVVGGKRDESVEERDRPLELDTQR